MKTVLKIVFRNLRANVRRTLETLFGVSLASFLAVLACSLVGVMEDVAGKHLFTEAVFIAAAFGMASLCIIGTFNSNFEGHVRMYGILASVGMTSEQLKRTAFTEAMVYGVTGTAIGALAGAFAVRAFYARIAEYISADGSTVREPRLSVLLVLLGCFLSLCAAVVAAYRPVRRLGKLTVIESLTAEVDVNISLHKSKIDIYIEQKYGFYGRFARMIFENHKRNYRMTAIALSGGTAFYMWVYAMFVSYGDFLLHDDFFGAAGEHGIVLSFALLFVLVFTLCSFGNMNINFEHRRRELAIMLTLGATAKELSLISRLEGVLLAYYTLLYGFIGSFVATLTVFLPLWTSNTDDYLILLFPFPRYFLFALFDIAVCMLFSAYNDIKLRRLDIVRTVKARG
ncbi:MAG: ABC transporter permease [Clostridia bacterium]|nr:ABC transporter permease [Clostridia bacterium]